MASAPWSPVVVAPDVCFEALRAEADAAVAAGVAPSGAKARVDPAAARAVGMLVERVIIGA